MLPPLTSSLLRCSAELCRPILTSTSMGPQSTSSLLLTVRAVNTAAVRWNKDDKAGNKEPILLVSSKNGVTTMKMNTPKKLNGWTQDMMLAIKEAFRRCADDPATRVAVLTGADPYYCAGVNLSSTLRPMAPAKLHRAIYEHNREVFDTFIEFPKPLMVAVNGPAIGACVTSATLTDRVIASERATFSTPFHRLGIPPEGCSSVHFARIMGKENAERMLGKEGWTPTGKEAVEAGLVQEVVEHDKLMERAQQVAEQWIKEGKKRSMIEDGKVEEYKAINDRESKELATAFLSYKFIDAQYRFLKSKGKDSQARMFWALKTTRPLWAMFL